jgi:hypothetical protein
MLEPGIVRRFLAVAALAAAAASCGDVVREGRSPVFLVLDSLQAAPSGGFGAGKFGGSLFSDVIVNLTTPAPCSPQTPCPTLYADNGQAVLHLASKDASLSPTSNNQVTITRYHVTYRRADGRNTPGADVPYAIDGAVTGTVPPSGPATFSFEIVRHVAKEESPLVQLISSSAIIATIADVTLYGTDQVGNAINVTGSISIEFGNFGDQ